MHLDKALAISFWIHVLTLPGVIILFILFRRRGLSIAAAIAASAFANAGAACFLTLALCTSAYGGSRAAVMVYFFMMEWGALALIGFVALGFVAKERFCVRNNTSEKSRSTKPLRKK